MNNLMWLEHWFNGVCDGTREHTYGIRIHTLENSGWHVSIDLHATPFDQATNMLLKDMHVSDRDWMTCRILAARFEATGGPLMLGPIIEVFRRWIETYTTP